MSFKSFLGSMSSFFGLEDETTVENFATPPKQSEKRFERSVKEHHVKEKPIREKNVMAKKTEIPVQQTRTSINNKKRQEVTRKKIIPTPTQSSLAGQGAATTRVDKKVVPLASERKTTKQVKPNSENANKIMVFEPRAYSEAMVIAKHILSGKSVLVNFHLMEEPQARRVVDFLTGTVYAEDGDIKRVAGEMFLCTPPTVEIEGTTKSLEESDQFDYNQLSL